MLFAGDQEQLAAVEGGGAMTLLAGRIGYVQLAEPVRITTAGARDASLRPRPGDPSALNGQHGRIHGGLLDQAMDQATHGRLAVREPAHQGPSTLWPDALPSRPRG